MRLIKKNKKGISPVIATVLLIALVIVLALIVFLWARGVIREGIQKEGLPADQVCREQIDLTVDFDSESEYIDIRNDGNKAIYRVDIIGINQDGKEPLDLDGGSTMLIGSSITITNNDFKNSIDLKDYDEIEVVPVILGEKDGENHLHRCEGLKIK